MQVVQLGETAEGASLESVKNGRKGFTRCGKRWETSRGETDIRAYARRGGASSTSNGDCDHVASSQLYDSRGSWNAVPECKQ